MIVKIQISLNEPEVGNYMLIYQRGKECMYQGRVTKTVKALMKGRIKAFFEAKYRNGIYEIGKEVSDPGW